MPVASAFVVQHVVNGKSRQSFRSSHLWRHVEAIQCIACRQGGVVHSKLCARPSKIGSRATRPGPGHDSALVRPVHV
jgi:hypothetical protein